MGGDPNGGMTGGDDLARLAGPQSDVAELAAHVMQLRADLVAVEDRVDQITTMMRKACGIMLDEVERQTGRRR